LLRHAQFLATTGSVENAYAAYHDAEALWRDIPTTPTGNHASRYIQLCAASERVALAHGVMAAIKMVEVGFRCP
jgi:hypothetical protein